MAASEIRIRVPHPSAALVNNLLGVFSLLAIVVAVGGLAGWLWGLLASGIVGVALCLVGATYLADQVAVEDTEEGAEGAEPKRLTVLDDRVAESA